MANEPIDFSTDDALVVSALEEERPRRTRRSRDAREEIAAALERYLATPGASRKTPIAEALGKLSRADRRTRRTPAEKRTRARARDEIDGDVLQGVRERLELLATLRTPDSTRWGRRAKTIAKGLARHRARRTRRCLGAREPGPEDALPVPRRGARPPRARRRVRRARRGARHGPPSPCAREARAGGAVAARVIVSERRRRGSVKTRQRPSTEQRFSIRDQVSTRVRSVAMVTDTRRQPLYTVAEAARIVRLPYGRARSWLRGGAVARPDDALHASFLDVIEMRFIHDVIEAGIPPHKLFRALRDAAERLNVTHPLTMKHFLRHGNELFPSRIPPSSSARMADARLRCRDPSRRTRVGLRRRRCRRSLGPARRCSSQSAHSVRGAMRRRDAGSYTRTSRRVGRRGTRR